MTALNIEKEKRDFEAWWRSEHAEYNFHGAHPPAGWLYFDNATDGAWQVWLAAKRASQPVPSGGDGLTDSQVLALVEVVRAKQNLPSLAFPTDRAIIAFARAIAAHISGQGGEDGVIALARKLAEYHPTTLSGMWCDGEPVGRNLIAAITAKSGKESG